MIEVAEPSARSVGATSHRLFPKAALASYEQPQLGLSVLDIATSVVAYLVLTAAGYALLDVSFLLVVALWLPAAGFLLRTFIVFHDCTHGSFMPSKRANEWVGIVCGLLVYSSFAKWKHHHAMHHATNGDLDRRGDGDVKTLTVAEYCALPWRERLGYRLFRNPFVMFVLGPLWIMLIAPRFYRRSTRKRIRRSVVATNLALAVILGALFATVGWQAYLVVQFVPVLIASSAGVWLFYVQHQFEETYWEDSERWNYSEAALRGSSHLVLPKVLQFFTGNIGVHHVHHLSARIPNYNLQRAHDENPVFHDVPTITLADGLRAVRLKLWDENSRRLITWSQARRAVARDAA